MGHPTILTDLQKRFLELVLTQPTLLQDYYWTGGTVLSEFYLHHRDSEDIDLFTPEAEVKIEPVSVFIRQSGRKLGAKRTTYTQFLGLHTFIFDFPDSPSLKVDFNYYPFTRIEPGGFYPLSRNIPTVGPGKLHKKLSYDSVIDIAVNKLQTIATKPRSRDFIDLYLIQKTYSYNLTDLVKKARQKFDWYSDPINLAAKFLLAREASDVPKMRIDLPDSLWRTFFLDQAKALQHQSFGKK